MIMIFLVRNNWRETASPFRDPFYTLQRSCRRGVGAAQVAGSRIARKVWWSRIRIATIIIHPEGDEDRRSLNVMGLW